MTSLECYTRARPGQFRDRVAPFSLLPHDNWMLDQSYTLCIMQRPRGVTVTAVLMALNACLDIAQSFVALPSGGRSKHPSGSFFSPKIIVIHIILIGMMSFGFFTIFRYWLGSFWARWLVLAGCVYYLTGLRDIRSQWQTSHFIGVLSLCAGVLSLYLIWYLHTDRAKAWFARTDPALAANSQPIGR